MTLSDQRTSKVYQMKMNEYVVAGINDWKNATQCNLMRVQLHKTMTSKWYQI